MSMSSLPDPKLPPHTVQDGLGDKSSPIEPIAQSADPDPSNEFTFDNPTMPEETVTHIKGKDAVEHIEAANLKATGKDDEGLGVYNNQASPPTTPQTEDSTDKDRGSEIPSTNPAHGLQSHHSPSTVPEDVNDITNASAETSQPEFDKLTEINQSCENTHEVIDLVGDEPYNGPILVPKEQPVKQEPDVAVMAEPNTMLKHTKPDHVDVDESESAKTSNQPLTNPIAAGVDTDLMELNVGRKHEFALPILEGDDDDFWQVDPEERAEETEDTMAMIQAAASNFRNSMPINPPIIQDGISMDDFQIPDLMDIDSEAEDAQAIVQFEEIKKAFLRKKKADKLEVADEIEYNRACQAEEARKRRRARNNVRLDSPPPDEDSMFFPENGHISPSPAPEAADETFAALMRDDSFEPAQASPAGTAGKKGRPRGSKRTIQGGVRKTTGRLKRPTPASSRRPKPSKPSTMNFGSLFSNDLIAIAQENQKKQAQPTFTSKNKSKALSELISSMPKEQQKLHSVDKKELERASKKFNGHGTMRADGAGGWKLKGMKSSLHHYQLLGAAFMRDLENRLTKPFGGFVADDMGLGKTVIALANILDGRATGLKNKTRATLVVAPSALLSQWMAEVDKHVEPGRAGTVLLYRTGASFMVSDVESALSNMGIVITSYHEVLRSWPKNDPPPRLSSERAKAEWWAHQREAAIGPLHRVTWRRVILDEAQAIKNHLSRTSEAVSQLKSKYRWAITGTPIQNRLEEFYAFFRFLDLPHIGSYETFRKNFCKRDSELAIKRLRQYLDQFMLRRTHADQIFGRPILKLPDIKSKTITVEFNTIERTIYRIVKERFVQSIKSIIRTGAVEKKYRNIFVLLMRLRQLTAHCLLVQHTLQDLLEESDLQRLWKLTEDEETPENQHMLQGLKFTLANATPDTPQPPKERAKGGPITFRFRKYLQSMRDDGKWAEIIDKTMCTVCKDPPTNPHITSCNHIYCYECLNQLSWHAAMDETGQRVQCIDCGIHFDRTETCSREDLMTPERGSPVSVRSGIRKGAMANAEESTDWFTLGGPILQSTKAKAAVSQIEEWRQQDPDSKIIVFTQFRGMIKVMQRICVERNWGCTPFHGDMSFEARDKAIKSFSDDPKCFVMLCGLKAGGVGLNLTAANRVIIIDLWWNQFVETQAFCRVYRIGQDREVEVARFVVKDSVDEDIVSMQERKNEEIDSAIETKFRRGRLSAKELLQLFATDLERDEYGDPIAGPNEEPFILTDDPYHQSGYVEDNSE